MSQRASGSNPARDSVEPSITTPDPGNRMDAMVFVWQQLNHLSQSFGQVQGKIDAEVAHSAQRMNRLDDSIKEVGEKMSAMDTRLTALSLNVSRIYWSVAAGAVVIGVLGPLVYLGLKRLLNIP